MKITVLCGGLSAERDVSLVTGAMAASALRRLGHSAAVVDLFLGVPEDRVSSVFTSVMPPEGSLSIPGIAPDIESVRATRIGGTGHIGENIVDICLRSDIVFIALHGADGEDGKIQSLLDLYGVKYTGTGPFGSALAMNKSAAKDIMRGYGIRVPNGITLQRIGYNPGRNISPGFPCVVKPCSGGSSVATTIVADDSSYESALSAAFDVDESVIAEEYISGREFSVGVLGGTALPVIEIIPKHGFYDYANKYQSGAAVEVCPADIPDELARRLQNAAMRVYEALRLQVYCRMDFIVTPDGNEYCLEANTLPGLTMMSLLPQEAAAAGMSYDKLIGEIVMLSLSKYDS